MSRTSTSPEAKSKQGLELFSDMMLMKFKPKSLEGAKKVKQTPTLRKNILGENFQKKCCSDQESILDQKINKLLYLELASKDTVIVGNYNQLDMFDMDGLSHNFIDTYHYWSFYPNTPILNLKVNIKSKISLYS